MLLTRAFACSPSAHFADPFSPAAFDLSIDVVALLVNLLISVLVPSVIGKVGRGWAGGRDGGIRRSVRGKLGRASRWPPLLHATYVPVLPPRLPPWPPAPTQLLRDIIPAVRQFVTKYKTPLSLFSTANLAFIVWQVLSAAQSTRAPRRPLVAWAGEAEPTSRQPSPPAQQRPLSPAPR